MSVRLNGSTSGYVELDAPAAAGNNTIRLPTANGSARQGLRNSNVPGELEWGLVEPSGNGSARQTQISDGAGVMAWAWDAGSLFYRLESASLAGSNVTTAQSVFGVGVTLAASTVYAFEALYVLSKTAGGTSHSLGLGFGGTATINNIVHGGPVLSRAAAMPTYDTSTYSYASNTASNTQVNFAIQSTAVTILANVRGTVSISAGGTFIPQYTLSAAPGGAYSTLIGSFIRFIPIGAAGTNLSQGTWS